MDDDGLLAPSRRAVQRGWRISFAEGMMDTCAVRSWPSPRRGWAPVSPARHVTLRPDGQAYIIHTYYVRFTISQVRVVHALVPNASLGLRQTPAGSRFPNPACVLRTFVRRTAR